MLQCLLLFTKSLKKPEKVKMHLLSCFVIAEHWFSLEKCILNCSKRMQNVDSVCCCFYRRRKRQSVWDQSVRFLSDNESRIRVENQKISGEVFEVWRWLQVRLDTRYIEAWETSKLLEIMTFGILIFLCKFCHCG